MANSCQAFLFNRGSRVASQVVVVARGKESTDRSLNFYLPQLIPSFLPSSPFRPPFSSHFRRTRIPPSKLIRFCAAVATIMSHSATQLTIYPWNNPPSPFFVLDERTIIIGSHGKSRRKKMKRSTVVRNETVSGEISLADSFYLVPPYCRGISLERKEKCIYDFLEGRNLWYRSRDKKISWILLVSLYTCR